MAAAASRRPHLEARALRGPDAAVGVHLEEVAVALGADDGRGRVELEVEVGLPQLRLRVGRVVHEFVDAAAVGRAVVREARVLPPHAPVRVELERAGLLVDGREALDLSEWMECSENCAEFAQNCAGRT